MFDEILFPTDGSQGAAEALEHVLDFAEGHGSTVHFLNVADTTQDSVVRVRGDVIDVLEREGEGIVEDAAGRARDRGIDTVTEVRQGQPYATILEYADARAVDLVAMPTRGRRGLERLLLGSTTERVVRQSDVPVLTIRPDGEREPTYPYRDVLVPTDGSDCARAALDAGVELVTAEDAGLHVLSVVNTASLGVDVRTDVQTAMLEESAREIVDEATSVAENGGVESVSAAVEFGASVHQTIGSYVEEHDIDLLIAGTHGRTGFDRYMLGSVTEALVRTSPIPVLTVRAPTTRE